MYNVIDYPGLSFSGYPSHLCVNITVTISRETVACSFHDGVDTTAIFLTTSFCSPNLFSPPPPPILTVRQRTCRVHNYLRFLQQGTLYFLSQFLAHQIEHFLKIYSPWTLFFFQKLTFQKSTGCV